MMVYLRDEGQAKQLFGGRHRRNEDKDIFKPRGDGPTLEEFGRTKKFLTSTRSRTAKESLTETEAPRWNVI